MTVSCPASFDTMALSRRLAELAGHEREVQVDFLRCLAEFDDRRGWAEAGYGSLWDYLLRVLHLREGAAGRRIAAMKVLRRWPALADALRDGRLCLSTVALLGPLLTDENLEELVARAAFLTKAQVERLVALVQPRVAPRDGLRLLARREATPAPLLITQAPPSDASSAGTAPPAALAKALSVPDTDGSVRSASARLASPRKGLGEGVHVATSARPTMMPVDGDTYSLRVTVDADFKADLDQLKALLAHKIPKGDLTAVLREAIRCAIEKHGKRKGAVEPARKAPPVAPAKKTGGREPIPVAVRRQIWKRDGGRCAWRGPDGQRCDSTWKLEIDHVVPAALDGPSTVDSLRLCCRTHNQLHAERIFGRVHMQRFRRGTARTGELTISSDSMFPRERWLPVTDPAGSD